MQSVALHVGQLVGDQVRSIELLVRVLTSDHPDVVQMAVQSDLEEVYPTVEVGVYRITSPKAEGATHPTPAAEPDLGNPSASDVRTGNGCMIYKEEKSNGE